MDNIINLIKTDKQFRASIIEKDENAIDVIYKFIESPECSTCISELRDYIFKNSEFINNIIKENTPNVHSEIQSTPNIQHLSLPPTPINVSGEVYEIEADPQQYKQLIMHSQQQRWIFRGINIMEKVNDSGKKCWVVFFY